MIETREISVKCVAHTNKKYASKIKNGSHCIEKKKFPARQTQTGGESPIQAAARHRKRHMHYRRRQAERAYSPGRSQAQEESHTIYGFKKNTFSVLSAGC